MSKLISNHKRAISMISFLALMICFLALMTTMPNAYATAQNSSKSHTPNASKFHVGDTVNFTITFSVLQDLGGPPLSIANLTIIDPLPVGETFVTGTNTSTPSSSFTAYPNGTLFWDFGPGPFETTPQAVVSYNITVTSSAPAGFLYNTATTSYDETLSGAHSAPGISDFIFIAKPAITLTKTPSATKVENGSSVTYTYNVTNTGNTVLTVGLIDNTFGTIFTGKVLAAGASNITTISQVLTANTTNIATATGVDQTGASVNANATATVQVIHPAIALTKTPSASKVENGTSVTYTYVITNTGDTSLTVNLTDNQFGTIFTGKVLAAGESNTTTIDKVITGNITNVATAAGVDQTGASVNANATATVQVIHRAIALTKTPSDTKVENGSSVTYTYNVTNTGDTSLTVNLVDNTFGTIFTGKVLAAGASNITTISQVLTANTTNIATATGVDQTGASVNANATAFVQVIHPAIALTKTPSPNTSQIAPATFMYTYNVTNTGDTTLSGVTVFDETFNVQITIGTTTLTPGQSTTGTYNQTYASPGTYTDIANATGTDQTGVKVTAFANATVVVTPPPAQTTRTWGFWMTHTNFTEWVFTNRLNNFIAIDSGTIHAKNITTYPILFGAFEANVATMSNGTKRTLIDSARISLLHQLLGAILNNAAFNTTVPIDPVTGLNLIQAGNIAYSSDNRTEILRIAGLLDTFNGSGDNIAFPQGLPPQGNATPQASIAIANKQFWDVL